MLFSVSLEEVEANGLLDSLAGKQLIWIAISFFGFGLVQVVDWKFWQTFAYPIYAICIVLLVGVLLFGITIKGATSWYSIGGFTIQPSEFAKFGTALAVAAYLSTYKTDLRKAPHLLTVLGIFMLPALLILLQPDAGSAIVFLSFFLALYREGLNAQYYLGGAFILVMLILGLKFPPFFIFSGLALVGIFVLVHDRRPRLYWLGAVLLVTVGVIYALQEQEIPTVWWILGCAYAVLMILALLQKSKSLIVPVTIALLVGSGLAFAANYAFHNILQPHQQDRINVWLAPSEADPQGSYYNIKQSKLAISSGGWFGQGYLEGNMTHLDYVPEQSTDFIFCTIGEEQGFAGAASLVILFLLLLFRLVKLAERQRSHFSQVYAYGLIGILFFHFFINIGMTMGLVPVIGIPLPFISKGGSALLGFTLMISALLSMDSHRFQL